MSTIKKPGLDSYAVTGGGEALQYRVASVMAEAIYAGDPTGPAWMVEESRQYLIDAVDGIVDGTVTVSVASLHLVLGYILHLEQVQSLQHPVGAA